MTHKWSVCESALDWPEAFEPNFWFPTSQPASQLEKRSEGEEEENDDDDDGACEAPNQFDMVRHLFKFEIKFKHCVSC